MTYRSLLNQHLSSARLILAELSRQENASHSLQRALEHSALHLLNSAYLCHLRAIADNYHCGDVAVIADDQALLAALVAIDKPAPEAAEIVVLINEGWLGQLLKAQQQLCLPEPPQIPMQAIPAASQSYIALRHDEREEQELNADQLQNWLLALEELVQRHSEMMLEY